jgi:hypothetical protein
MVPTAVQAFAERRKPRSGPVAAVIAGLAVVFVAVRSPSRH